MPANFDLLVHKPGGRIYRGPSQGDIYAVTEEGKGKEIISFTFTDEIDLLLWRTLVDSLVGSEGADELKSQLTLAQVGTDGTRLYVDGLSENKEKIIFSRKALSTKQPVAMAVTL